MYHQNDTVGCQRKNEIDLRIRNHPWPTSSLGKPEAWPQPLRTTLCLLLGSKFPMFVLWGPERTFLYNETYSQILGEKHPSALGRGLTLRPEVPG